MIEPTIRTAPPTVPATKRRVALLVLLSTILIVEVVVRPSAARSFDFQNPLAAATTRDVEEFVTELRYRPEGWAMVALAAAAISVCWLVVWMYRHEGRMGASLRVRMILGGLRCAVLLTLIVIVLEPVHVRIIRRWIDSYTLLMVDTSSSMDLADAYADAEAAERVKSWVPSAGSQPVRRADVVQALLQNQEGAFPAGLAENNRVKLFTFGEESNAEGTIVARREAEKPTNETAEGSQRWWKVGEIPTAFPATGPATNVDRAIRRAVDSLSGAPLAAVVVLSDGGFNQGASPEETARFAHERRVPIYTVGIGDPSPPRNARVSELVAPANAFQQDPFAINAQVAADGIDGRTLRVQLHERNATEGGEGQIVALKDVFVGAGGAVEPITFQRRQSRAGRYVYTVEVPGFPGESVADDNSRSVTVNVIESRTKVLIVAGGATWDFQFVSRLLERDDTFDVSCWLQSADAAAVREGDVIIDHLPATAEEILAYDLVILMDADPAELDETWSRLIDRFVSEHGGGLLVTASRRHTPDFIRAPGLKPLRDLLPITPDPDADLVLNRVGFYQLSGVGLEVPESSWAHPVLQMGEDPVASKLAWQGLGDIHWHYPVLREKPAATVLMRHADPKMRNSYGGHVLAAVQFVGSGRSGFLALDGTYRWRRNGEQAFNRFWIQMVRFLSEGKLLGGAKRGMLFTEADQAALGDVVRVSARLFDARFEPLVRDEIAAEYRVESERTEFTLRARPERPGWFEGQFVPDRVGSFRVSLRIPDASAAEPAELIREVRVSRPNLEILRPQMDRLALATLAERSAGGRYFDVNEAAALAKLIPDLHEEVAVRSSPTSLWDNGRMLTLLVGFLAVEWAVRKWRHLL
jgi:hypothetical protein